LKRAKSGKQERDLHPEAQGGQLALLRRLQHSSLGSRGFLNKLLGAAQLVAWAWRKSSPAAQRTPACLAG